MRRNSATLRKLYASFSFAANFVGASSWPAKPAAMSLPLLPLRSEIRAMAVAWLSSTLALVWPVAASAITMSFDSPMVCRDAVVMRDASVSKLSAVRPAALPVRASVVRSFWPSASPPRNAAASVPATATAAPMATVAG